MHLAALLPCIPGLCNPQALYPHPSTQIQVQLQRWLETPNQWLLDVAQRAERHCKHIVDVHERHKVLERQQDATTWFSYGKSTVVATYPNRFLACANTFHLAVREDLNASSLRLHTDYFAIDDMRQWMRSIQDDESIQSRRLFSPHKLESTHLVQQIAQFQLWLDQLHTFVYFDFYAELARLQEDRHPLVAFEQLFVRTVERWRDTLDWMESEFPMDAQLSHTLASQGRVLSETQDTMQRLLFQEYMLQESMHVEMRRLWKATYELEWRRWVFDHTKEWVAQWMPPVYLVLQHPVYRCLLAFVACWCFVRTYFFTRMLSKMLFLI